MTRRHPLANCEECPLNEDGNTYVPSDGPEKAQYVFVGEAPGFKESMSKKPFSGPSGKLLNAVLGNYGIKRDSVFLTNVCLCRPSGNATPTKQAIKCCSERLKAEIDSREPETIVTLGVTASSAIMGKNIKITQFRAGPPKSSDLYPGARIVPTFHPAACLRAADSFPSLVTDIGKATGQVVTVGWEPPVYAEYDTEHEGRRVLDELLNGYERFVIDIETAHEKDASFERPNHYPILCVGLGFAPNRAVVLGRNSLRYDSVRLRLKSLIEEKKITCHNGKFDLSGMAGIGRGRLTFDTMLASYALDERGGVHRLKYIAAELLGCPDYDSEIKQWTSRKGESWATIPPDDLHRYNATDVTNTWAIEDIERPQLTGELAGLNEFLVDMSNVLMDVEMGGMTIDTDYLETLDKEYQGLLEQKEADLVEWVDNPRSVPQVKTALEKFGINVDSTDAEHLHALLDESLPVESKPAEFVRRLLAYRKEQKLYGTYIKGLRDRLFEGRIYSTFLLHGTTTGRPSSRNPNLFNIPRGSTIKRLFVPSAGNVFVQCDYSQIEFRVVTCLAQEPSVAEIFRDQKRDVFGEFALQLFGPDWNKHHRQIVKRIVHGTDYGMGPKKMAEQMNSDAKSFGVEVYFSTEQAGAFQKIYHALVPNIMDWQRSVKETIFRSDDDLVTTFGRHRRFQLITDDNKFDIEHEGLAFIPQSTASDICSRALMRLHGLLDSDCHIRLSVYDSIMIECPAAKGEDVARLATQVMMDSAAEWSEFVPFHVDAQITAESWGAFK